MRRFITHAVMAVALAVAWSGTPAEAQVRRVEVAADSSVTRRVAGRQVTELFNVTLTEDATRLRAQRAIDHGNGEFDFYTNVEIIEEGDTLTADEVRYNRNTRLGRAAGSVRLGDGEVVVTAPEGDFDLNADRADFRAGVQLRDSVSVLTSQSGSYWTGEKRAEFFGEVRLDSDETDVLADSLEYFREGKRSDARGRVLVVRQTEEALTYIMATRALNDDSLGTSRATGNVLVARIAVDSLEVDTLYIRAREVVSETIGEVEWTAATDSVVIWSSDFSARADSVSQLRDPERDRTTSRLFGSPMIWVDQAQVSGDSMRVTGTGNGVDSLLVRGTSFVAQRDTLLDRLQQLKGRGLVGLFRNDSLRALQVTPNAEAVYFNRDDADSLAGALRVTADRIRFLVSGGEITDLRVYQDVAGTYFPLELIPEPLQLDGLPWRPDARPDPAAFRRRLEVALARFHIEPLTDAHRRD